MQSDDDHAIVFPWICFMQNTNSGCGGGKGIPSGLNSSASMLVEVGGGVAAGEKIEKVDLEEKWKKEKEQKRIKSLQKLGKN